MSDIYSKKDMEFTRGMLLGMDQSGIPEGSVSLKIINGEIAPDSLRFEVDLFTPDVIVTTHEKDVPSFLTHYTSANNIKLLNVFDAKGEEYMNTPGIYQLLPPSGTFNKSVADNLASTFSDDVLLVIGTPEPSDAILKDLTLQLPENSIISTTRESIAEIELEPNLNYIIYPASANTNEVKEILAECQRLYLDYPECTFKILGRPNWIAYNNLGSMTANLDVYIPSKCFFDPSSRSSRRFISDYSELYGKTPIKSFPVYAVMGYDMAKYFFPLLLSELNGQNVEWNPETLLQSRFNMVMADWGSGAYNKSGFILHFEPWGSIERIPIE